jgi:histidyl-tRNA synthetase
VEQIGGAPAPGIGFGIGIERLLMACDAEGCFQIGPPALDAFVVDLTGGEAARDLCEELRRAGLGAERGFDGRSLKSQLKLADRSGARVALIVGPEELSSGEVTLRELRTDRMDKAQRRVPRSEIVGELASPHGGHEVRRK